MNENEEEEFSMPDDPAKVLPFERRLEPDDPNVVKLPKAYTGSLDKDIFGKQQGPVI